MTTARRRAVGAHTAGVFLAATLLALSLNLSPVLTAAAAAPTATTSDQAVAYQTTITHSSGPVHDTLAPPLMRIWSTQFSGGVSYPLIANGRVFVTAVDATTRHPFQRRGHWR